MINVAQTITTIIPQSEEGRIFASALEGGLRDIGTFKSRNDSTVTITIVEERHYKCDMKFIEIQTAFNKTGEVLSKIIDWRPQHESIQALQTQTHNM